MKNENAIRIILCIVIGVIVGFVLLLFGESTSFLVNSIAMAFILTLIANELFMGNSLRALIDIIVFAVGFFVHGSIIDWLNGSDSFIGLIFWGILYFGPFAALTFIFTYNKEKTEEE